MEIKEIVYVSPEEFFNTLAVSVQYEINEYGKKKVDIKNIKPGIKYIRELKDKKGKVTGSTNVEIMKWEAPRLYEVEFRTTQGTTTLGYELTEIDKETTEVRYYESFTSPSFFNRLNYNVVGFFFTGKGKNRIKAVIRGIEQFVLDEKEKEGNSDA